MSDSVHAVVRIKDVQYRVRENELLSVPLLSDEVGSTVEFNEVLLVDGAEPRVGTPTVEGAKVVAEVVEHGRGKKIIVFKKKRRKGYRRTNGHRQDFTSVRITSISV